MRRKISKESKIKLLGKEEDSEDLEDDFIVGNDQNTEKYTMTYKSMKSSTNKVAFRSKENLNDLTVDQLRERAREIIKKKRLVDEDTIRHFLEFHHVQFMPRDLTFIMSDLGTRSMEIGLEMFDQFLFSEVWNI